METVVIIIMLAVALTFLLKLTFLPPAGMLAVCALAALFVGFSQEYAVSQSKTQIADWLADPQLMLDTSVLLTLDVAMQIAFCFLCSRRVSGERLPRWQETAYLVTLWFPGILIFPVLFSLLVEIIFAMPGMSFAMLGWSTAIGVLIAAPLLSLGLKWLLPDKDSRLELIFLVNLLTAALGVIATVNGRTATAGTAQVDWTALCGVLALIIAGAVAGLVIRKIRVSRKY